MAYTDEEFTIGDRVIVIFTTFRGHHAEPIIIKEAGTVTGLDGSDTVLVRLDFPVDGPAYPMPKYNLKRVSCKPA